MIQLTALLWMTRIKKESCPIQLSQQDLITRLVIAASNMLLQTNIQGETVRLTVKDQLIQPELSRQELSSTFLPEFVRRVAGSPHSYQLRGNKLLSTETVLYERPQLGSYSLRTFVHSMKKRTLGMLPQSDSSLLAGVEDELSPQSSAVDVGLVIYRNRFNALQFSEYYLPLHLPIIDKQSMTTGLSQLQVDAEKTAGRWRQLMQRWASSHTLKKSSGSSEQPAAARLARTKLWREILLEAIQTGSVPVPSPDTLHWTATDQDKLVASLELAGNVLDMYESVFLYKADRKAGFLSEKEKLQLTAQDRHLQFLCPG